MMGLRLLRSRALQAYVHASSRASAGHGAPKAAAAGRFSLVLVSYLGRWHRFSRRFVHAAHPTALAAVVMR